MPPSQKEMYLLLLGREGEGIEFFLHLLILDCLQLKIIFMPKWQILGVVSSRTLQIWTPRHEVFLGLLTQTPAVWAVMLIEQDFICLPSNSLRHLRVEGRSLLENSPKALRERTRGKNFPGLSSEGCTVLERLYVVKSSGYYLVLIAVVQAPILITWWGCHPSLLNPLAIILGRKMKWNFKYPCVVNKRICRVLKHSRKLCNYKRRLPMHFIAVEKKKKSFFFNEWFMHMLWVPLYLPVLDTS